MAGVSLDEGIVLAMSPEEADVVIVNTCAFIDAARDESVEAIISACELKQKGNCRAVVVAGCMTQRYREELVESLPEVDAFIGVDELENVGRVVLAVASGSSGILEVTDSPKRLFEPRIPDLALTGGPFAYVKIAEGCNHKCAFCSIPGIRGVYRSRPVSSIVREAESLLEAGLSELDLISQDTTRYGLDLGDGTDLSGLLKELCKIGGDFWIRMLYGHPHGVSDKLLETMAGSSMICRYIDIPIQHSHPEILSAMSRSDTIDDVINMPDRVRSIMPDAALRTTCITGFPGETEKHFEHLLDHVCQAEYDQLGVFVYSPEEGTPAFEMKDVPDRELAEERREILMLTQADIVDRKLKELKGVRETILLDYVSDENSDIWIGRSKRLAPEVDGVVFVDGVPTDARSGIFVNVKYAGHKGYDLIGTAERG
jgi:ribosomal protein S12 methylthiotransferase